MKKNDMNRFIAAHNELVQFCIKCLSSEKSVCDQVGATCDELKMKMKELYYDKLYPFHPCGRCLVRVPCQGSGDCTDYWFYYHSRDTAECELTDNVAYFTSDRSPFIRGHRLAITKEYINSDPRLKKIVDFNATAEYISEMKSSAYYSDLLETVRQYREYRDYVEDNRGEHSFVENFF